MTSAEDDLTDRLQEMISQACCNHGLFRDYSLYPRKRLVSYTVILVFQHYHIKFLGSLWASLMLLHPSPSWAESLVHVHFKEEIGIAELIPLVTTYIILFAYIYFSTRRSTAWRLGLSPR